MNKYNYFVEILLVAHNAEKTISDSLLSVFNQTFTEWSLVLINDGSTDNTDKIIVENLKFISKKRVKYVKYKRNLGLAMRLSQFKPQASTLFIAMIDADDIWMPHKLSYQLIEFFKDPSLSIIGSSALTKDQNKLLKFGNIRCYSIFLFNKFILPFKNTFVHSSLIIRASVFNKVNGYSEKYKYSQDYFLLLKVLKFGKLRSLSEPLVLINKSENQISTKYKNEQIFYVLKAQYELNYSKKHIKVSSILNNMEISKIKKIIKLLPLAQYIALYCLKFLKDISIIQLKNLYN